MEPQQEAPGNTSNDKITNTDNGMSTYPYEHTEMFHNFFELVGQEMPPRIWDPADPSGVKTYPEDVDRFTQECLHQWF